MATLYCGRCPATDLQVFVQGMLTDPDGWSCVTVSGKPMRNNRLCPSCTTDIRSLLDTPPAALAMKREDALLRTWRNGYEDGCNDTERSCASHIEVGA